MKEKSKSICHHDNCYYYSSVTLFVLYYYIMTVSIPRQEKRKFTKKCNRKEVTGDVILPPIHSCYFSLSSGNKSNATLLSFYKAESFVFLIRN